MDKRERIITWVDVKEKQPSKSGYYLTTVSGQAFMHYWNNDRGKKCWYSLRKDEDGNVIKCESVEAWAELPKPM